MLGASLSTIPTTSFPLYVGMDIEISEQNYKRCGISKQRVVHPFWKIAINVERMHAMDDGNGELDLRRKNNSNYNTVTKIIQFSLQ